MILVFLDESGNHNLDIKKFDNIYNLFVLGAVCFREEDYKTFDSNFRELKKKHFGSDDYILHTCEITRPSKATDERTKQFNNTSFREDFYHDLNTLIESSQFSVIACAIEKDKLIQKYVNPEDPYHFSIENILNRSFRKARGDVIRLFPEHRDSAEDRKLELRILQMKVSGTQFYRGIEVAEKIDEFRFMKKSENHSGSQLIDLIVTPIGRHLLGKTPRPGNEVDYEIIKQKITRSDDFTIFP